MNRFIFPVLALLLLTGCDLMYKPIPTEYADFVGTWEGNGVLLVITKDGGGSYEKLSGGGSYSLMAPVQEIDSTKITLGLLFLRQDFIVNEPPHEEDGKLKMSLDGDLLVKKEF